MNVCFGVDVGGTSIKFGMFDSTGLLINKWEMKTPVGDGKILLECIARNIIEEADQSNITYSNIIGIGVGIPGSVKADGYVEACVNLGVRDLYVSKNLSKLLGGVPVFVANDANTAALGEMWQGGGQGYNSLVLITLGTGVGSGIVIDGKVLIGRRGIAGEIGHIMVNPDEPEMCNCGGQGCLDQIASATGLVTNMHRLIDSTKCLENSIWHNKEEITAKDILDAARLQDPLASTTVEYCMEFLGRTIATIGQIVDPDAFIIGGGLSKAGDFLLEIIERYYRKYSTFSRERVEIVLAQLGNDAGIYGAAKMALDGYEQEKEAG
ncbi:MAG: ROK family glucokinase [Firmicutes bacterium]|nr:ROK family glucokinase [Bacillota bacterium]